MCQMAKTSRCVNIKDNDAFLYDVKPRTNFTKARLAFWISHPYFNMGIKRSTYFYP